MKKTKPLWTEKETLLPIGNEFAPMKISRLSDGTIAIVNEHGDCRLVGSEGPAQIIFAAVCEIFGSPKPVKKRRKSTKKKTSKKVV